MPIAKKKDIKKDIPLEFLNQMKSNLSKTVTTVEEDIPEPLAQPVIQQNAAPVAAVTKSAVVKKLGIKLNFNCLFPLSFSSSPNNSFAELSTGNSSFSCFIRFPMLHPVRTSLI